MSTERIPAVPGSPPLLASKLSPISVQQTGLIIPERLALGAWEKMGHELAAITNSSTWWLADWVRYGELAYTGRYREVIERTGLSYQTLRNYAWVARQFALARRRPNLSFAHHAEVASLEPAEQDYWLRRADQGSWSRNQLRKEVRASHAERRIPLGPAPLPAAALVAGDLVAGGLVAGGLVAGGLVAGGLVAGGRPLAVTVVKSPVPKPGPASFGPVIGLMTRPNAMINVRLSLEHVARGAQLANAGGLSLTDWAAGVLRDAIAKQAGA